MRDLEIRGAGNLLGENQSGHIAAVGYDLYVQMVNEAVAEMKGEQPHEPAEVKLDVPTDAYLPLDYVRREELRLEAYRRLASVTNHAEVDDIEAEWEDRYGPVPEPARNLLAVGHLRAECFRLGLRDVAITSSDARLAPIELRTSEALRLRRLMRDGIYKEAQQQLVLPLRRGQEPTRYLLNILAELFPSTADGRPGTAAPTAEEVTVGSPA
jgi:transcription-repair coupling factor (superfamily II helicase)